MTRAGLDRGLDPKQIVGIRQLIKSLAGAHTVILSTHILPEVSMVCEGVIIINRGRVVASGPLDRLMQELSPVARIQVQIEGSAELVAQSLRALPGVQRVARREPGTGRTPGCTPRSGGHGRVGIDRATTARRQLLELLEHRRVVHPERARQASHRGARWHATTPGAAPNWHRPR